MSFDIVQTGFGTVKELYRDWIRSMDELGRKAKEIERLNADLARVTEELSRVLKHDAEAVRMLNAAEADIKLLTQRNTAAQERTQALEGMVGMLRGTLLELKKEYENSAVDPQRGATYKWSLTRIGYALNLTESQAAEVVRGMERVVEAARNVSWLASDAFATQTGIFYRGELKDALAALEAARGLG